MYRLEDYGKSLSVSAVLVGLFLVFVTLIKTSDVKESDTSESGYSMVRPSEYQGDFDLSDRAIERMNQKKQLVNKAQGEAGALTTKGSLAAAKNQSAKKISKNDGAKKKGSLKVSQVNTRGEDSRLTIDTTNTSYEDYVVRGGAISENPRQDIIEDKNPDNEEGLTPSQWRAQFQSSPSVALAKAFLAAHADGKIDHAAFYQIALELFTDAAPDRKAIGWYILDQDNSAASFSYIAAAYAKVNQAQQADLWKLLLKYTSASKFSGLAVALGSSNAQVVDLASRVLTKAIDDFLALAPQGPAREGRGLAGRGTASAFRVFVPVLRKLSMNPDQSIVSMASGLLARILNFLVA